MLNVLQIEEIIKKPAPCDTCSSKGNCKNLKMACTEFAIYVNSGHCMPMDKPMPNTYIYEMVMRIDDDNRSLDRLVSNWKRYMKNKKEGKYVTD
jgi:hypothetical protein